MKSKMRKWTPFSSSFFIIILAHCSGEVEKPNLDENAVMMKLIHRDDWDDPRVSGSKIKKSGVERLKEFVEGDIIRYKKIGGVWRVGHGGRENMGQYIVQVQVGTPSRTLWLIADVGSDLTWLNCIYKSGNGTGSGFSEQNRVFVASHSKSFQRLHCSSELCIIQLNLTTCPSSYCEYERYENGSNFKDLLGTDNITIGLTNGRKATIQNMLIGCTTLTINGGTIDGVLGLGIGKDTFLEKAASQYGGIFSYCLVDNFNLKNVSSYLIFGHYSTSKTKLLSEIQHTELLAIPPFSAAYLVNISIEILQFTQKTFDLRGGIAVIDSGSTFTTLPRPVYEAVINALTKYLDKYERLRPIYPFNYCYNASGFDMNSLPKLVFYFAGGVRFQPPLESYIIDVGPQVKCISLLPAPTKGDLPGYFVIGKIMLQNHLWEFDFFGIIMVQSRFTTKVKLRRMKINWTQIFYVENPKIN